MERNIFSVIKLTLVLGFACGAVSVAADFLHEHTDNIRLISIERVDSTHAAAPTCLAMQH